MQGLHLQPMTFSQARHPTKTREINGTETPHTTFLHDGRVEIDSNRVENLILTMKAASPGAALPR